MMSHATMNRYLARLYAGNILLVSAALFGVVWLFDTVELLRRASKKEDVPLSLVAEMGLLKLPETGFTALPFAILFAAIFTFWQLARRQELVAVRAAGFSVWQFLAPILGVAVVTGALVTGVLNPLGSIFLGRYEILEETYLAQRRSQVALFEEGLWLRQTQDDGYVIMHADGVTMPEWRLRDVMVLYFGSDDSLTSRVDAKSALLGKEQWEFHESVVSNSGESPQVGVKVVLPTDLTADEIEERFSSPDHMSFWAIPAFVRMMEGTGFDATRLRIRFQSLLAQPLLYASMVLLAAAVSLRPHRFRNTFVLIFAGVLAGFAVFFMSSFLQALGASHQIPPVPAAWTPAFVSFLLGVTALLNQEDG